MKNLRIGDKVKCTHAQTSFYRVGEIYDVVQHTEAQLPAIKARDGFLDLPDLVMSKFEKVTGTTADAPKLSAV